MTNIAIPKIHIQNKGSPVGTATSAEAEIKSAVCGEAETKSIDKFI